MKLENPVSRQHFSQWQLFFIQTLMVSAFFCLYFLLEENMGRVNEVNVLPFARQHADPSWIPKEWYYNLPGGYRTAFIFIFGNLAAKFGFLFTSIAGRFLAFTLIASGFVFLARTLKLTLISLLVAVTALLLSTYSQGLYAEEWIIRALEPKAIAYGFLLLGISFMLRENYRLMALFLGLTISFHVLVGGWAAIAVAIFFLMRRPDVFLKFQRLIILAVIYLLAASLAIRPILQQLTSDATESIPPASYIYVHLRTPHHLNPAYWSFFNEIEPIIYFIVFVVTMITLWKRKEQPQLDLGIFALCTMIPFLFGVIISPWDTQGKILQYYPFRLGDIMFPLITCLLFLYLLQSLFFQDKIGKQGFIFFCVLVLSISVFVQGKDFYESAIALQDFPSKDQMVNPEWKEMCSWIRENTDNNERFISHPIEDITFTWLSERATIVKYKFVPAVSAAVAEWYQRLNDLSGTIDLTKAEDKKTLEKLLHQGYPTLTTEQVRALMDKYEANYIVTNINHKLDLETVHQNSIYILYAKS